MLGGTYVVYMADNGFGELIPSPFPIHMIKECSNEKV